MSDYNQDNPQDLRHMLSESLGVARRRRWVFVIPATVATLAALAYTFTYPRVYNARTMFERRDSLVMSNLIRSYRYDPYSFPKMRHNIYVDIKGYKAVERAVEELGLDKELPRDPNGQLTDEGARRKQAMINAYSAKCEVYLQDKTDTRDIITVSLPSKSPAVASDLVTKLRENYLKNIQERMNALLVGAKDYFKKEVNGRREAVSKLEAELVEFRSQFTGVDPADPEAVVNRMTALRVQKEDLSRRIDELEIEIDLNEGALGRMGKTATGPGRGSDRPKLFNVRIAMPETEPNPAYLAEEKRIEKLKEEIFEKRTSRMMTAEHPEIRRLHMKITQLEQALSRIPPTLTASGATDDRRDARRVSGSAEVEKRLQRQEHARAKVALRSLEQQRAKAKRDLEFVEGKIARYESEKSVVFERREEFLRRQNDLASTRTALEAELKRYHHVEQLLNAEKSKRGIIFTVLEETQVSGKPVSPKLARLFTMSIGFGVAVGLGLVLLLELLDRTFRSVGQVAAAIRLPVLQSIGEIVAPEARRRRLIKQVAMHAVTAVLIGLVCLAGGLVYFSLERPQAFERFREDPGAMTRQLLGAGL